MDVRPNKRKDRSGFSKKKNLQVELLTRHEIKYISGRPGVNLYDNYAVAPASCFDEVIVVYEGSAELRNTYFEWDASKSTAFGNLIRYEWRMKRA